MTAVTTPVPLSGTACEFALLFTVSVPLLKVCALGVNVTWILQEPKDASDVVHVVPLWNRAKSVPVTLN